MEAASRGQFVNGFADSSFRRRRLKFARRAQLQLIINNSQLIINN
jgi:hypothetical protein